MIKKFFHQESGQAMFVFAAALIVLIGFAAFTIDIGVKAIERQSLQNALDAAALAAAQDLPSTGIATVTAKDYANKNGGYAIEDGDVSFDSYGGNEDHKVIIENTQTVEYLFAKVFMGGNSSDLTVRAAAARTSVLGSYDYALFSGSEIDLLQFTGKNTIVGDVHSNYKIKNEADITGNVTAADSIDTKINVIDGSKTPNYGVLDMPNYHKIVDESTPVTNTELLAAGATYKKGEYTIDAAILNSLLAVHDYIKIDGDLKITKSGDPITAKGSIVTTGDITFEGSDVSAGGGSAVCICSINGDITFNGGKGDFTGILYAPNGTVTLDGGGGTVFGSIIADEIDCNGGMKVTYNPNGDGGLPRNKYLLVE